MDVSSHVKLFARCNACARIALCSTVVGKGSTHLYCSSTHCFNRTVAEEEVSYTNSPRRAAQKNRSPPYKVWRVWHLCAFFFFLSFLAKSVGNDFLFILVQCDHIRVAGIEPTVI
jgi:hypothetical protein